MPPGRFVEDGILDVPFPQFAPKWKQRDVEDAVPYMGLGNLTQISLT